jgi:hypothetical protein
LSREVVLLIVGGLLTFTGALGSQCYQVWAEREKLAIEERNNELRAAVDALSMITSAVDPALAYAELTAQAIHDSLPDSTVARLFSRYREARETWAAKAPHARTLAYVYFGDDGSAPLQQLDSVLTFADHSLLAAVDLRREARSHTIARGQANKGDPLTSQYHRTVRSLWALQRENAKAVLDALHYRRAAFEATYVVWTYMIKARQTGSFDPIGHYRMTPSEEARLRAAFARRDSLVAHSPAVPGVAKPQ